MCKRLFAILLSTIYFTLAAQTLTLMSYNIRNGIGNDTIANLNRTAQVIIDQNPDIVAIQEVDSMTCRSNHQYILGNLAEMCNMYDYYAPAIEYDGGKYGIGILSRTKPLRIKRHSLPGQEERRTCIFAEYDDYVFCCTHLSLTTDDQISDIQILADLASKYTKPVFIAGDFNALPSSPEIAYLKNYFTVISDTSAPTYPADNPIEFLDYICVDSSHSHTLRDIKSAIIPEASASDHRPIIVTLNISKHHE